MSIVYGSNYQAITFNGCNGADVVRFITGEYHQENNKYNLWVSCLYRGVLIGVNVGDTVMRFRDGSIGIQLNRTALSTIQK